MASASKRRVGVVGYGHLGKYLVDAILKSARLELAFVWNRTCDVVRGKVDEKLILEDLSKFSERQPGLIVEVAHPSITANYGEAFLDVADYMVGSPTALADPAVEEKLRAKANSGPHGLYIPSGALWGANDIKKMADRGNLRGLKVTMKKDPSCFKLNEPLKSKNAAVTKDPVVLYDGPVGDLCPLAPNNVNTMAAAAIAAHNLGFGQVQGCLVAHPNLEFHIVEIEVTGPGDKGQQFAVQTTRTNPANTGVVTGRATYASFLSSTIGAHGLGPGVHLC